jgi:hypothetical protein
LLSRNPAQPSGSLRLQLELDLEETMAKSDLVNLMLRLFGDPALFEQVRKDGWASLQPGLTQEEIDLLEARDPDKLKAYLGADSAKILTILHWLPKKED